MTMSSFGQPVLRLVAVWLIAGAVVACGSEEAKNTGVLPPVTIPLEMRFLPLKEGVLWTYQVKDASTGVTTMKQNEVVKLEEVPARAGVMAFRVKTTKGVQVGDQTVSWQQDLGSAVVRLLEHSYTPGNSEPSLAESWDPHKLRLDEHPDRLKAGTSWTVDYAESHMPMGGGRTVQRRSERWTVDSVTATVKVPCGEFNNVLLVRRVGTDVGASSDKHFWYARGIGKLRETGGQVEELVSVTGLTGRCSP